MKRMNSIGAGALVLTLVLRSGAPVRAQQLPVGAIGGGVPSGTATDQVLQLSLADAINRGLAHNLAIILQEQQTQRAAAGRLQAMAALLPNVSANVRDSVQVFNTAAFGFGGFGDFPTLIGPFSVFDIRLATSMAILDVSAVKSLHAAEATADAAKSDSRQIREIVVLAVGNLYLEAISDAARVESTAAQVKTAEALVRLSTDQNAAGVAPRIDVLRQQTELESARTQSIQAANQFAKRKLELARAIGLPAGQNFELADTAPFTPAPPVTLDAALAEAMTHRQDV